VAHPIVPDEDEKSDVPSFPQVAAPPQPRQSFCGQVERNIQDGPLHFPFGARSSESLEAVGARRGSHVASSAGTGLLSPTKATQAHVSLSGHQPAGLLKRHPAARHLEYSSDQRAAQVSHKSRKCSSPASPRLSRVASPLLATVLPCLEQLDLSCSTKKHEPQRSVMSPSALQLLSRLPSLTHLCLDGRTFDLVTLQALSQALSRLVYLSIDHCFSPRCGPAVPCNVSQSARLSHACKLQATAHADC
jgi:hypothetical protein